jgi:hypothetical protein
VVEAQRLAERVGEVGAGRIALVRILRHGLGENVVDGRRQVRADRAEAQRRRGQVRVEHRDRQLALERHRAAEHLEGHAGERVLVGPAVDRLAVDLLGGGVVGGAEELAGDGQRAGRQHRPGDAEVRQVGVLRAAAPRVDEDVARLDVAVDKPGGVRGVQGGGDRGDERRRPARGQRADRADDPLEGAARHEPHRDELHAVGLARRVDGDDVRVVDGRDGAGLAHEPHPDRLVAGQQLQRHDPAEPLVPRLVHGRHPADADQALKQVPGHAGARGEPGQQPARRHGGRAAASVGHASGRTGDRPLG